MLFFWFSYAKNVVTPDETGYFAWAEEWASGEYRVLRLYGDRTVVIFLLSLTFRLFGVNINVGRWLIHSFGIGLMAVTYFLGKEVYDRRVGILAMLILTFSGFFLFLSYFGLTDIPSTFFFVCTILFFRKAFESKDMRYSILGGLFFLIGPLTKISYMVVIPIVFIMWLKRTVKKELSLNESLKIAGSSFILPIFAVLLVFVLYSGFIVTTLNRGIVLFASEILDPEFLRDRLRNLIWKSGEGLLGPSDTHPTSLSNLVRVLLFPQEYEGPGEQIYFQYYLVERWMWLVIICLSLLFRRTRKFDLLAWIIGYLFVWLVLTPSAGSIHVAEISDRYLYPILPAIYIQFARLVILALDEIRTLMGKPVLDLLLDISKKKKVFLYLPSMIVLFGLVITQNSSNLSPLLIGWGICLLIFFRVARKEKVNLTVIVASVTVIFLILSNLIVQIRITDTFAPSTVYRETTWMFPPDMLGHEKINAFEEGAWFWASQHHVPTGPFTIKIFNEAQEYAPGRLGGIYVWFSNQSAEDRSTMYVRWTADYYEEEEKEFSGYFEGHGIEFISLKTVDFENTERVDLEDDNYLAFQGEVRSTDHDGFNVDLKFIPNYRSYWIDWDLIEGREGEEAHIFVGNIPLINREEDPITHPPHRIIFSTYSLHLRWRGGPSLINQPVFFNITYEGFVFLSKRTKEFPSHENEIGELYQYWGPNKRFIPVQSYTIWSMFEDKLKEVDLFLSYGSWPDKQVEFESFVYQTQTDPSYLHIGKEKRDVPLKIELIPMEDFHQWSISEGFRPFFKDLLTSGILTPLGFLTTIWMIALVPLIWPTSDILPFEKAKKRNKSHSAPIIDYISYTVTRKIKHNRLKLISGWLFLGGLSLSLVTIYTRIVPFWWGIEGRMYFEGFMLHEARWLFFWRIFEELILVGTITIGFLFVLRDLLIIVMNQMRKSSIVKEKGMEHPHRLYGLTTSKRARLRRLISRKKTKQVKNAAASVALLGLVTLTFFIVIRNNWQYMDELTANTQDFHETMKRAYKFLEDYAKRKSKVMAYQVSFGKWYTQNKFRFEPMDSDWDSSDIWVHVSKDKIDYVVISAWDDYHPFNSFEGEKYADRYHLLWAFEGTVGHRTAIYETIYSDTYPDSK